MAIAKMITHAPLYANTSVEAVPLLENPRTPWKEISYRYLSNRLCALSSKCFPGIDTAMQSFRAGGDSTAHAPGGETAASAMGHWQSDAKWRYLFFQRPPRCKWPASPTSAGLRTRPPPP
jgi:hypothetical protein